VFLSVEFCFTLETYRKGAPFYNASALNHPDICTIYDIAKKAAVPLQPPAQH
jgi:hypothetical protein